MTMQLTEAARHEIWQGAQGAANVLFTDARLEIKVHLSRSLGSPAAANLAVQVVNPQGRILMAIPAEGVSSMYDGDTLTIEGLNISPQVNIEVK